MKMESTFFKNSVGTKMYMKVSFLYYLRMAKLNSSVKDRNSSG